MLFFEVTRFFFVDDVERAALSFGVDVGNVEGGDGLGDHEETDEEGDENRELDGAVPVESERVAEDVLVDDAEEAENDAREGDEDAEVAEDDERGGGHRDEAVEGEVKEFFQVIGRFAGGADAVNIFNIFLFETEPVD